MVKLEEISSANIHTGLALEVPERQKDFYPLLLLSHLEANVDASRFYQSLGFAYTGEDLGGGDLMMALQFDS